MINDSSSGDENVTFFKCNIIDILLRFTAATSAVEDTNTVHNVPSFYGYANWIQVRPKVQINSNYQLQSKSAFRKFYVYQNVYPLLVAIGFAFITFLFCPSVPCCR